MEPKKREALIWSTVAGILVLIVIILAVFMIKSEPQISYIPPSLLEFTSKIERRTDMEPNRQRQINQVLVLLRESMRGDPPPCVENFWDAFETYLRILVAIQDGDLHNKDPMLQRHTYNATIDYLDLAAMSVLKYFSTDQSYQKTDLTISQ
jgi:hypothetical protein